MCGIAGELRLDGTGPQERTMRSMLDCLRRRGPDSEGVFTDGGLALGHRRLSIIDLSTAADQPMQDAGNGLNIVFNGTIYNYPDLRRELQGLGHSFRSTGDTEVILKAYAQWGERCVERLIGMFAFGIWDSRRRRLFLARDRMGIKPLYYSESPQAFRFASNTQALLAAGVDTDIDPLALHHHMSLHAVVPAPRTLLKGIRKLPPAHTLSIGEDGRMTVRRYWSLNATRPAAARSEGEWIEAVHEALRVAVERRLRIADVPVGVLLSGGLDSSLLVALLAESGAQGLKTFTVGFEDQPEEKGSEFEYSDPVAERYATEHYKFEIPNSEVLTRLPEAIDLMSEPMVAQDAVAFYLLSEQVSRHVKAVQSGQGADEVFGGYFWYPQMAAAQGAPIDRFRSRYFDRDHAEYLRTVAPAYATDDVTSAYIAERLNEPDADAFIDQVLRLDVTTLIVDDPVKRVDNMTMAWGLEARVPFLDHELVELAARMPPELKLASGGKHVLKQIARGRIPDAVIDRKKGYFPVPALKYVRGEAYDFMADVLNARACRERGLYRRDYVDALLANPEGDQAFTAIRGNKLWHLALLELWLQRNVDGKSV
ncbi:N-acetylglutaminylglutamine amidotransferase [Acidihalobacter ferrooxydans]|uniref:asparagine synthase (glutamine-hydrolyzing) n=1 Tax=Acidihalobacter ferrooxydans TaxID=1765967 RepID=A0A1P8UER3_9GAMM|nr:N-acetylglutaminylglutamine amidotransferase [Acidihalobacter ferrooxydans]APZ42268.1 asparagine synthase (glutamine-hydrolyzing) [Acidihalobacter ferrooxydans]